MQTGRLIILFVCLFVFCSLFFCFCFVLVWFLFCSVPFCLFVCLFCLIWGGVMHATSDVNKGSRQFMGPTSYSGPTSLQEVTNIIWKKNKIKKSSSPPFVTFPPSIFNFFHLPFFDFPPVFTAVSPFPCLSFPGRSAEISPVRSLWGALPPPPPVTPLPVQNAISLTRLQWGCPEGGD